VSDKLTLSQLMVVRNLSHGLLKSYLAKLVSAGLLGYEEERGKRFVWTTVRGIAVLKCYRNAIALLNGYPSSCPLLVELGDNRKESEMLAAD
jgi:predicted transcriptional regulator